MNFHSILWNASRFSELSIVASFDRKHLCYIIIFGPINLNKADANWPMASYQLEVRGPALMLNALLLVIDP